MTTMLETRRWIAATGLVAALLVAGCTGYQTYREAQVAENVGDWDDAVLHYLELVEKDPTNISYRAGLLRSKIQASQQHFRQGREFHQAGILERAMVEYQQAVQLDKTNEYAMIELQKVREELAAVRAHRDPVLTLEDLKRRTRGARPQPPTLNPRSQEPISLDFPEPVSMFSIYQALGKAFGINILFDPQLRDQQMAIELEEVTAQSALETLMRAAGHFYKVLDEHSIIVAADTPQNRRKYEDLVIQTFFLSNAEVKDVMTMLRSLVGARNIAQNDQLNAIVLRDTADKVKVAERIILTNDKSRGEVIIDVELLQINTNKLQEIGISLTDYQISQTIEPNPVRASDLEFLNQSNWLVNIPSVIYNFVKSSSEAELLAKPQLRISDGEEARLLIGDRVPIPVTTFNTSQTVGGNIVPITSFQYQDVGIRIELEPRIHHNKEVTLSLTVEVSQLSGSVTGSGGQEQPIIGTRTIESTIRLKDGETNFLAGLIRTDQTTAESGVPGLSEIPILGRLFSSNSTDAARTDLVLTMTPHIIRTPDIGEEDLLPIWVGTEANITFRGGSPRVESDVEGPFDEDEERGDEIREMIRRRIQNLPRGLRDQEGGEAPEDEEGTDLVPPSFPDDFFDDPFEEEETDEGGDESSSLGAAAGEPALTAGRWRPAARRAAMPGGVRLSLAPAESRPAVGETVTVGVEALAGVEVSHLPMVLTYDPRLVAVEAVEAGEFLGSPGEAELLADASRPGRLLIGASRLGRGPGALGGGRVATVRLRALAPGSLRLELTAVRAMDRSLAPVGPVELVGATLVVEEERGPGRRAPSREGRATRS